MFFYVGLIVIFLVGNWILVKNLPYLSVRSYLMETYKHKIGQISLLIFSLTNYSCVGNLKVEKALAEAPTALQNCCAWVVNHPLEAGMWGGVFAILGGLVVFYRGGAFTPILSVLKPPKVYSPGVYIPNNSNSNLTDANAVKTQDIVDTTLQITAMPQPLVNVENGIHLSTLDLVGAPQNATMFKRLINDFCIEEFLLQYFIIIARNPLPEDAPFFDNAVNFIVEKCPKIPRDEVATVVQEICDRLA